MAKGTKVTPSPIVIDPRRKKTTVKFGQFFSFLLEHPEARELTGWSDAAIRDTVDCWMELTDTKSLSRILDVGCGFGLFAIEMARRGHYVVAVEPIEFMLDRAMQLAAEAGVTVQWMQDSFPCDVGGAFDIVCTVNFFAWQQAVQTCREVRSCLKPGGFFVADGLPAEHEESPKRSGRWLFHDSVLTDTVGGTSIGLGTGREYVTGKVANIAAACRDAGLEIIVDSPWLIARRL